MGADPVKTTTDMKLVSVDKLIPYANNSRTHSKEQILKLRSSLREFGFVNPVIIDRDYNVIAGHGRITAAKEEGIAEVPCVFVDHLTEAQKKAYILADNRMALDAGWDEEMLRVEIESLREMDFDPMLAGFDEKELAALFDSEKSGEEDNFDVEAELDKPAFSMPGDLWILGRHRLLCGDCTVKADRDLLLDGAEPEVLLTDPPYCSGGQKESSKSTGSIGTVRKDGKQPMIANDILSTRGYQNLIAAALKDLPCLFAYVFTDWRMWVYLFDLVEAAGYGVKSMIVWDKGTPGMGIGWRSQHEIIMFAARASTHFDGHKGYGNVLSVQRSGNSLHPTQKPLELLSDVVDNMEWATGFYDPFGGSGTTLIACEDQGATAYVMELTPGYTDVIVERYIRHTGRTDVKCIRNGKELGRDEIAPLLARAAEGGEDG